MFIRLFGQFIAFSTFGIGGILATRFGYSNFRTGDKDILFPLSAMIFFFFSLLIFLPQTHGKIAKLSKQSNLDDEFPIGFLLSLGSFTLGVIIDKFFLNKPACQDQQNLHQTSEQSLVSSQSLRFFLTIALSFINISNSYFITSQKKTQSVLLQLIIYFLFNLVIAFAYGYLLAWSKVEEQVLKRLYLIVNFTPFLGFALGLFIDLGVSIVILPCLAVGFMLYASIFLCLPKIFTNGEKPVQDKFRYWAIFTALLLTIIYYPILYLMKI